MITHGSAGKTGEQELAPVPRRVLSSQLRFSPGPPGRPQVNGKFIEAGGEKLYLRGVTYGTFEADPDGFAVPDRAQVARDLSAMRENGVNALRVYTVPPEWLLDLALELGIWVMVGLPWEEHVTFLDDRARMRSIVSRIRQGVRACQAHPAVLAYAVGNEIPASIARWHGPDKIERFIERLFEAAKLQDPEALVTYANYPTTEYLHLPFLDFQSFNVFLEEPATFESYLARLHTLADDRPLVLSELGLDSRSHGLEGQADFLDWQARTAFEGGCAGTFVFAWTDEWHRGEHEVREWDFGLVDRERKAKPALSSVRQSYSELWRDDRAWPRFSVVVCTHNGARTLGDCLDGIAELDYPDYEVIVVDDGSTDGSAELAAEHGALVIRNEENEGLAVSRNRGAERATGEVIAYVDDDARPDSHWLRLLAITFSRGYAAAGGPNLPPHDDPRIAACVADAPGGPIHVLISDIEAEHVPGCNMAVRKDFLLDLGGFDSRFRIAGDDVDLCWRLRGAGHRIGFAPGALVWHRRRSSVRAYVRQQYQYGKSEALLERKWPARYNRLGHVTWSGHVYGMGSRQRRPRRSKIGYGTWGSRLFQSVYEPAPGMMSSLAAMPEWYLVAGGLALLSILGLTWSPLYVALPVLAVLVMGAVASSVARDVTLHSWSSRRHRLAHRSLVVVLSMLQPMARLLGRIGNGLSPWRRPGVRVFSPPWRQRRHLWSQSWAPPERWIEDVELRVLPNCSAVTRGAETDRWDLEVHVGAFGTARLLCAVEEHGNGQQLVRFRIWPRCSRVAVAIVPAVGALAAAAGLDGALLPAILLGVAAALAAAAVVYDCALAMGAAAVAVTSAESPRDRNSDSRTRPAWAPALPSTVNQRPRAVDTVSCRSLDEPERDRMGL